MSTIPKSNQQTFKRRLSFLTLVGIFTLLSLLFVTLFFGPETESELPLTKEYLAYACQRPSWLDEGSATGYEFEPISPTPVAADNANTSGSDDAQLSHVAYYTRTQPYIEYDFAAVPLPEPYSLRWRMGIGIPEQNPLYFQWPQTRPGWYLNWTTGYQEDAQLGGLLQRATMAKPDEEQLGMSVKR